MKFLTSTILLVAIILCTSQVNGQVTLSKRWSKYLKVYNQSTLIVVKTKNDSFNNALINSVKEYWNSTPVKIIENKELDSYSTGEYTCLILDTLYLPCSRSFTKPIPRLGLMVKVAGPKPEQVGYKNVLAFYPMLHKIDEYTKKTDYIIKGMQDMISFVDSNNVSCLCQIDEYIDEQHQYYNETLNANELLKNKTLLVNRSILHGMLTESAFRKEYKFKVKFVDQAEFNYILQTDDPNYCALLHLNWPSPSLQVYHLWDKSLIYSGRGTSKNGICEPRKILFKVSNTQVANLWDVVRK